MSSDSSFKSACDRFRHSNRFAVFLVYSTLMVDNMLLSAVVPVLPAYLYQEQLSSKSDIASSFTTISPFEISSSTTAQTNTTSEMLCEASKHKNILDQNNMLLSFILASKPLVQFVANAAVGPLVDRMGCDVPMFMGYIILILSSTTFALGETFVVLFFSRAVQGIGSALASTSGLAMLANRYRDDEERGNMLGVALGGLAMGVVVGPLFGSVIYQVAGKKALFLILAGATFILATLQLISRQLKIGHFSGQERKSSFIKLLGDPYILLAATAVMLGNMALAIVQTGLPTWLIWTMCTQKWMLGLALMPMSLSYMITTIILPRFVKSEKRWLVSFISCYLAVAGTMLFPFCKTFPELIGPGLLIGFAIGMIDTTMLPHLGLLADTRHSSLYGSAFAIADAAVCVAFTAGPLITGVVVRSLGFKWLMFISSIINFAFAPLVCFLRNPSSVSEEEERKPINDHEINVNNFDTLYNKEISSLGRVVEADNNRGH